MKKMISVRTMDIIFFKKIKADGVYWRFRTSEQASCRKEIRSVFRRVKSFPSAGRLSKETARKEMS